MKPQPDSPPGENAMIPVRDAPAFDFYPERWLVGVAGMSDAEQLTYLRLLCHQWLLQGLPADLPALKRLGGGKGVTPAVLAKLPLQADGKRRNARLEIIRTEQRERIAKKSEQRRAAALKRWHSTPGDSPAGGMRPQRISTCETAAAGMRPHSGSMCETDASGMRTPCGSPCETHAAGMPTTHPVPPTPSEREHSAGAWPGLDEVKAYAPTVMALPECAESFWNGLESCGWVNKFGQPVSDWKPLFRNFATAWKSNDSRAKGGSSITAKPKNQAYQRPAHVSEADTQF